MDVFCDARETGSRFARYVIDLRRLFLFHGLACGQAENFVDLAVKLEESRALRLDLPALLRNIRDLEQGAMSADEMLTVVALASGGEELVDGRASAAGLMRAVGLMRMMLAGVGTWAETNGTERAALVMDEAATVSAGSGEERVFLELAIEELRLQLGDVARRMREMEPRRVVGETVAGETAEAPQEAKNRLGDTTGAGEIGAREADFDGMTPKENVFADVTVEHQRVAAERVADEQAVAKAQGVEAERVEAEQRAADAEREREREATWPLEERVSTLPPLAEREPAVAAAVARSGNWRQELKLGALENWKQRGGKLRLGAVAAGLLLATVGIYGSLRSASARADKESGRAGGAVVAARPTADAVTVASPAATPAAMPTVGVSGPVTDKRTGAQTPLSMVAPATEKPGAAKLAEGPAGRKAEVPTAAETGAKNLRARGAVPPEVVAKNRRDDAAMDAVVAQAPQTRGKFLFVPAEVMEKYLVSARRPVPPVDAAGDKGRVVLNAFIAKDGTVSRTDVVEGPPKLINSAMAAVSWRRYRPFLVRGQPAEVVTPVTVSYAAAR